MTEKTQQEMKTGEMAERARQAGVQNVEQMNKREMQEAMSRAKPQQGKAQQQQQRGQGQQKPRG